MLPNKTPSKLCKYREVNTVTAGVSSGDDTNADDSGTPQTKITEKHLYTKRFKCKSNAYKSLHITTHHPWNTDATNIWRRMDSHKARNSSTILKEENSMTTAPPWCLETESTRYQCRWRLKGICVTVNTVDADHEKRKKENHIEEVSTNAMTKSRKEEDKKRTTS